MPTELLRYLVDSYQQIVERHTGTPFPQDPTDQLRGAIEAVFRSWNGPRAIAYRDRERIAHDLGTAVNVQAMVFGNRDDNSGTGVGFTRDPATGSQGRLRRLPGQRPGRGRGGRHPQHRADLGPEEAVPQGPRRAARASSPGSSAHYRDMCDTEFTIEQGKLWMLQTRVGKRTGAAALKMAVDMVRPSDLGISKAEAVSPHHRGPPRLGAPPPVRRIGLRRRGPRGSGPARGPRSGGSTSPPTTPRRRPSGASR